MNLSIIHTANIGILIDSLGPYKYFDIKNLEFHPQKIANRPPPKPKKKCNAPPSWENVLLSALLSRKSIHAVGSITGFRVEPQRGF